MKTPPRTAQIIEGIAPLVEQAGLNLWGVELMGQPGGQVLRIYVEAQDGVTIDQCAALSRDISLFLDVEEDLIPGKYTFEVSSPGMERPFFSTEQIRPYVGKHIDVRLSEPIEGRKNFKGLLEKAGENEISVIIDDIPHELPWAQVARAKLVVSDWAAAAKKKKKKKK
jgi:ribosome maturation factor RimP